MEHTLNSREYKKDEYYDDFTSCLQLTVETVDNFNHSVQTDIEKRFSLNPEFLPSLNISEDSKLVMLSSLNFSMELEYPFDDKKERIDDFHTIFLPDDDYEFDSCNGWSMIHIISLKRQCWFKRENLVFVSYQMPLPLK